MVYQRQQVAAIEDVDGSQNMRGVSTLAAVTGVDYIWGCCRHHPSTTDGRFTSSDNSCAHPQTRCNNTNAATMACAGSRKAAKNAIIYMLLLQGEK